MLKVTDYRPIQNPKNSVVGHVDVISDKGYQVNNITHMKRAESEWFSMPSFKKDDAFTPIFSLGKPEADRAFLLAVKPALKEYLENNKENFLDI